MNLILCGLTRSGKSTIAKKLSEQLQLQSIDTDHLIEMLHGSVVDTTLSYATKKFR